MARDIRIIGTYPPTRCGIGTFSRDLATALYGFTGEVGAVKVAAIDKDNEDYYAPVDLVIRKYDRGSWIRQAARMEAIAQESKNPTTILSQHEYGLDPLIKDNGDNQDCRGNNYVEMARRFARNPNLTHLVYLHTVLEGGDANSHQIQTLQELARYSDGLIVTTKGAVDTLSKQPYNISPNKLKHIDHGIRINNRDRLDTKKRLGAEGVFLATQLGLRSPGKGIQYFIPGIGQFIKGSLTDQQREGFCAVIAGQYHPDFIKHEGGRHYDEHKRQLLKAIKEAGLRFKEFQHIEEARSSDFAENDILSFDVFLSESNLLDFYSATNVNILPYLNLSQVSSGILADTLGSSRVPIATKFKYAREMLDLRVYDLGIKRTRRGILVDPERPKQIAEGLDFLVFNKDDRLEMEVSSGERGHQMRWPFVTEILLRHLDYVEGRKSNTSGRGVTFTRLKESTFNQEIPFS